MLVVALVLSRLDYGNVVLVCLPVYLYNRLQSVLNAAARSITGLRRSDHITDTLASYHCLKVPERVQFKLATIVIPFTERYGSSLPGCRSSPFV